MQEGQGLGGLGSPAPLRGEPPAPHHAFVARQLHRQPLRRGCTARFGKL